MPITEDVVADAVARVHIKAQKGLPADVLERMRQAAEMESNPTAKRIILTILRNAQMAAERANRVVCQDTAIASFAVKVGCKAQIEGDLKAAIKRGVEEATRSVPLIPHSVHPITRVNSGTNTGPRVPLLHIDLVADADYVDITAMPVGAGSENVSALKMFTAADSFDTVKQYIMDVVAEGSGRACPPIIVGVGLGTQFEMVAKLAKEAAMRPLDKRHPEPDIAALEEELLEKINRLGVGPMGMGGDTTALAVNVEYGNTHTPNMPVAVKVQCWAARRETVRIGNDGSVTFL